MKLLIWIFPLALACFYGYNSTGNSVSTEFDSLTHDIAALELQLAEIDSGNELYPTIDSWMKLKEMAEKSGADLVWLKSSLYEGRQHSYSGVLTGKSKNAIALVGMLQTNLPIVIHDIDLNNSEAVIRLSVIGVNK